MSYQKRPTELTPDQKLEVKRSIQAIMEIQELMNLPYKDLEAFSDTMRNKFNNEDCHKVLYYFSSNIKTISQRLYDELYNMIPTDNKPLTIRMNTIRRSKRYYYKFLERVEREKRERLENK